LKLRTTACAASHQRRHEAPGARRTRQSEQDSGWRSVEQALDQRLQECAVTRCLGKVRFSQARTEKGERHLMRHTTAVHKNEHDGAGPRYRGQLKRVVGSHDADLAHLPDWRADVTSTQAHACDRGDNHVWPARGSSEARVSSTMMLRQQRAGPRAARARGGHCGLVDTWLFERGTGGPPHRRCAPRASAKRAYRTPPRGTQDAT